MRIHVAALLSLVASTGVSSTALAADPAAPGVPWARRAHDRVGPELGTQPPIAAEDLAGLASHWEGDMLFTPDGMPADAFAQLGREPEHAMAYEPTVGILYVAMEGVTLSPMCGNGDSANAA